MQENDERYALLKGSQIRHYMLRCWSYNAVSDRRVAQGYIASLLHEDGTNVLDTTQHLYAFPVDVITKKNNHYKAYLVSTKYQTRVSQGVREFADFFNIELFVAHVKPDLSWHYIEPVDKRSNYCLRTRYLAPLFKKIGLIKDTSEGWLWKGINGEPDGMQTTRPTTKEEKEYWLSHYKKESCCKMAKATNRDKHCILEFLKDNLSHQDYHNFISGRRKIKKEELA